jgi:hypothetical protein
VSEHRHQEVTVAAGEPLSVVDAYPELFIAVCMGPRSDSYTVRNHFRPKRLQPRKRSSIAAEARFRARVEELGCQVVGEWQGVSAPIDCICAAGHACSPIPESTLRGRGICRTCVGRDPRATEAAFRARVAEIGGTVIGEYTRAHTPVDCICPAGHPCRPRPSDVGQGEGMCWSCRGSAADVFYVVTSPTLGRVKFGITSGDPRSRLRNHQLASYTDVARVITELPDAARLERHVSRTLADLGHRPVAGREYFDVSAAAVVIDLVDGWVAAS